MKDLIILGNGMAGMTAALYAKRANLDFKIVGKDEYNFGQIGEAILVENYPCTGTVSGFDLAMRLYD
jgi:thioredoxin reductase (NADPH)